MSDRVVVTPIVRLVQHRATTDQDLVAVEAPLEVLLTHAQPGAPVVSIGLLMRTPGDDHDLVRGLLVGEEIVTRADQIRGIVITPETSRANADVADPAHARVTLAATVDLSSLGAGRRLDRSSACGLCGRLAMQAVRLAGAQRTPDSPAIDATQVGSIPSRLRSGQAVFEETGGLHAAALCGLDGTPWLIREDVGRHNAVDKVIGAALAAGRLPTVDSLLAVSGRVAFEIVQKAAAAGVVGIVAVGAPSSLAVDAARAAGLTLIGFVRDGRFNVYSGHERVRPPA
jgi:FdhD protein